MNRSRWWKLTLTAVLLAGLTSGCTVLRTPYEKAKIAENGGQVKKKQEGEGAGQASGGENKEQSGGKGGGADQKDEDKKKTESKANTKATPRPKNDPLTILQEKTDDKNPHLMYSQTMSSEVSQLEGIVSSTILLDEEHNAYVAIYTGEKQKYDRDAPKETNEKLKVKTEGDISSKLQGRISKKLRELDPLVDTVYITDNPAHAASFQRYALSITNGGAATMNTQALAEHIEDIWK
ncbi:YhcN/YlaJ family sporulation lipoprotein [Tumebacillus permanentifrigoris]|uniref:Sporulation lipoprotein YhcN/YlaJ n=1 Tax=Tumebacillus permanentifrigoris TaxID=378543 RepID=A0A316D693_9BACL|nr:YhcN/YlaJ family sporulation lipoprotein [Tumebacillus permanentifrigoris]PWK10246.1 sporulation lipoprotein YhcN/YlaJ [Tumebacillus permanentifrigoris]